MSADIHILPGVRAKRGGDLELDTPAPYTALRLLHAWGIYQRPNGSLLAVLDGDSLSRIRGRAGITKTDLLIFIDEAATGLAAAEVDALLFGTDSDPGGGGQGS